jgi:hypothetical protein
LPELLVMQGRIMLEHQLEHGLDIKNHGVYIPEDLMAENRLTSEKRMRLRRAAPLFRCRIMPSCMEVKHGQTWRRISARRSEC